MDVDEDGFVVVRNRLVDFGHVDLALPAWHVAVAGTPQKRADHYLFNIKDIHAIENTIVICNCQAFS